MMSDKIYNGYAWIKENETVPFRFQNAHIELFFGDRIQMLDADLSHYLLGKRQEYMVGGSILFHFPLALRDFGMFKNTNHPDGVKVVGTLRHEVDFYVVDFIPHSIYTQVKFSFPELELFAPILPFFEIDHQTNVYSFSADTVLIKKFDFIYQNIEVSFSFRRCVSLRVGFNPIVETTPEIVLEFKENADIAFVYELYIIVYEFFCFICNRQNIGLDHAKLIGRHPIDRKLFVPNVSEKHLKAVSVFPATLVVPDEHKEPLEDKTKILRYDLFASAFEGLFSLFVEKKKYPYPAYTLLYLHEAVLI